METQTSSPYAENGRYRDEARKNRLLSDFEIDPDHWNKVGFWCAIHNAPKSDEAHQDTTESAKEMLHEREEIDRIEL